MADSDSATTKIPLANVSFKLEKIDKMAQETAYFLAGSHNEAISPVAISPSNTAIYLWDIALLHCERSGTNESVLFISDISPSNKAIYHLWHITLLQYERSCTNESVLFISDILLDDITTGDIASV